MLNRTAENVARATRVNRWPARSGESATRASPGCSSRRRSLLLLAINIFPLFWAIYLSFTNYRANRPNEVVKNLGFANYQRILGDQDIWIAMQTTAHFVFWTIRAADADRLYAGLADRPEIPRPRLLDDADPGADDAVTGSGRQFLALPLRAADRPVLLCHFVRQRHSTDKHPDAVQRLAGAVVDHHRRHLDVDALRDADLPRRTALDPRIHL